MWDGANAWSTHTCRGGGGPQPVANWTVFASTSEGPGTTVHVYVCVSCLYREQERARERERYEDICSPLEHHVSQHGWDKREGFPIWLTLMVPLLISKRILAFSGTACNVFHYYIQFYIYCKH